MLDAIYLLVQGRKRYLLCVVLGFIFTWLITPLIIKLARRLGVLDKPSQSKIHTQATPLLGGLAVFAGTWLPILVLYLTRRAAIQAPTPNAWNELRLVFLAGAGMLVAGIWDDKRSLSARGKFAAQIPIIAVLVYAGIGFQCVHVPGLGSLDLGCMAKPLSFLFLLGLTNAFNLIDGIDGLAAGVAFLISSSNAVIALVNGNQLMGLVMCSLAGASLGFLRYNRHPARIFLGDTGSLFLGVTLAATSVLASHKSTVVPSLLVPLLLMAYPALDTLLSIVRRVLSGKSPFSGDQGHLHHRLLQRGLNHRIAALVLQGFCLMGCVAALGAVLEDPNAFLAGIAVMSIGFLIAIWSLGYLRALPPGESPALPSVITDAAPKPAPADKPLAGSQ